MNTFVKLGLVVVVTGVVVAGVGFSKGSRFISEYSLLKQQESTARETLNSLQVEKKLLEFANQSGLTTDRDPTASAYKEKLNEIDDRIQASRDDLAEQSTRVNNFGGKVKKTVAKLFNRLAHLFFS